MIARTLALSLSLPLALALAQGVVAPAAADEDANGPQLIEEVLEIDDVSLRVGMRLPEGWRHALEYGHTLTAYTPAGGGRALSVTADPNETLLALGAPEFPLFVEGERVESWAGDFAGHPARFFRGRGNERNQVIGLDWPLEGTRMVIQLDACIGPYARPVVAVARSDSSFESLHDDPHLARLAAMVSLELPEDVQPCADDLAEGLGARAIDPPAGEGWTTREVLELAVSLPRRFVWHQHGAGGFSAQDRSLPDDWFLSVFTERLDHAEAWRDELPADADIRMQALEDDALAGRFAAHRVAFEAEEGEGNAIVLVARERGADGRHMALVMLSLGQPSARAVPQLEAILSRLEAAE